MEELQFHRALEAVWSALDHANRYIVQTAPFTLIKDPAKQARVGEILHHSLEVVRTLSRVLAPFMPDTARDLRTLLNLGESLPTINALWGEGFAPATKSTALEPLPAHRHRRQEVILPCNHVDR